MSARAKQPRRESCEKQCRRVRPAPGRPSRLSCWRSRPSSDACSIRAGKRARAAGDRGESDAERGRRLRILLPRPRCRPAHDRATTEREPAHTFMSTAVADAGCAYRGTDFGALVPRRLRRPRRGQSTSRKTRWRQTRHSSPQRWRSRRLTRRFAAADQSGSGRQPRAASRGVTARVACHCYMMVPAPSCARSGSLPSLLQSCPTPVGGLILGSALRPHNVLSWSAVLDDSARLAVSGMLFDAGKT